MRSQLYEDSVGPTMPAHHFESFHTSDTQQNMPDITRVDGLTAYTSQRTRSSMSWHVQPHHSSRQLPAIHLAWAWWAASCCVRHATRCMTCSTHLLIASCHPELTCYTTVLTNPGCCAEWQRV